MQAEQTKDEFARLNDARRLMDRLVEEKINGGYQNVQDSLYGGTLTKKYILGKVDMTRCYTDQQSVPAPAVPPPQRTINPVTSRASRMIQCGE